MIIFFACLGFVFSLIMLATDLFSLLDQWETKTMWPFGWLNCLCLGLSLLAVIAAILSRNEWLIAAGLLVTIPVAIEAKLLFRICRTTYNT